jgi:hypothetical protein
MIRGPDAPRDAAAQRAADLLRALVDAAREGRTLAWASEHLPEGGDLDGAIRAAWELCDVPWVLYRVLDATEAAKAVGAAFERMTLAGSRHGHDSGTPCRACAEEFRRAHPAPPTFAALQRGRGP